MYYRHSWKYIKSDNFTKYESFKIKSDNFTKYEAMEIKSINNMKQLRLRAITLLGMEQ